MPTPRQAAAEGMPKFPGYEAAFEQLESPISHAFNLARVLFILTDDIEHWERVAPEAYAPKAIAFLISELFARLADLDALHLNLHNAGQSAGRGEAA